MTQSIRRFLILGLVIPLITGCQLGGERAASRSTATAVSFASPEPTAPVQGAVRPQRNTDKSQPGATALPVGPSRLATAPPRPDPATNQPLDQGMTVPEVVRQVRPAVVQVITKGGEGSGGTGSGFIIDKESHIITNNHVVEGGTGFTVVLNDNTIARAQLIGRDARTDLAVLQIKQKDLPTVPLGDSNKLQVGETVIAIGNALGLSGGPTVTAGVVSALHREAQEPSSTTGEPIALHDLIQTDTAINPGNSGGPLLNLRGEVIGINTLGQISTGSGVPVQGINYAVSANTAKDVTSEIIRKGSVTYPFMGIAGVFVYPDVAIRQDIQYIPGQLITRIESGTPAEEAGLRPGDIITAIEGKKITNESEFITILRSYDPGDRITVTIRRSGIELEKQLTLARRSENR